VRDADAMESIKLIRPSSGKSVSPVDCSDQGINVGCEAEKAMDGNPALQEHLAEKSGREA
jgi:hypothetical protein